VEGMVSHRLGLEEVASAMDLANFSDSGKIVIDLGESR